MFKFKNIYHLILPVIILLILISCRTTKPGCNQRGIDDVFIRWGKMDTSTKRIEGYEISPDYKVIKYGTNRYGNNEYEKVLTNISIERRCELVHLLRKNLLHSQTLNLPGDTIMFVEYLDKKTNFEFKANWNDKYKLKVSEGFRSLYDTLSALIPVK